MSAGARWSPCWSRHRRVNGARSWIRVGLVLVPAVEVAKLALRCGWRTCWRPGEPRCTAGSTRLLARCPGRRAAGRADHAAARPRHHGRAGRRVHRGAVLRRRAVAAVRRCSPSAASPGVVVLGAVGRATGMSRLLAFIDPESPTRTAAAYQSCRPVRAGRRRLVRRRPRAGRAKWSYLPNADTDFIFAIIGEELGFIGALVVLAVRLLAYTGLRIARRNIDPFVRLVVGRVHRLAGRPGRDQHRLRGRAAAGDRHPAAADLRRRHLAADHHGRLRHAGQRRPARAGGLAALAPRRGRADWPALLRLPPAAAPSARPRVPAPGGRRRADGSAGCRHDAVCRGASPAAAPPGTSSRRSPSPTRCAGSPDARITALGTERGLETHAGPGPRLRPGADPAGAAAAHGPAPTCCRCPAGCAPRCAAGAGAARPGGRRRRRRLRRLRRAAGLPGRPRRGPPIVVHEANARAGLANKVGARFATRVVAAVPGSGLHGRRGGRHPAAPRDPDAGPGGAAGGRPGSSSASPADGPTLLVSGGSQGARRSTRRVAAARRRWPRPASRCCTRTGRRARRARRRGDPPYVPCRTSSAWTSPTRRPTSVLGRAGAMTVRRARRGRAAGGLRAAAARQRRAGAQRRARSWRPAGACWSTTPS